MASANTNVYIEPVGEGVCEVLGCSNPAKYRAQYAQGIVIKLLCANHKAELEGKLFEELNPSVFGRKRHAAQ